jgi:hypothetical protein
MATFDWDWALNAVADTAKAEASTAEIEVMEGIFILVFDKRIE